MAYGVIKAFKDDGRTLPLIIGQENQHISELLGIPSVEHYSYELGKLAVRQILADENNPLAIPSKIHSTLVSKRNQKKFSETCQWKIKKLQKILISLVNFVAKEMLRNLIRKTCMKNME